MAGSGTNLVKLNDVCAHVHVRDSQLLTYSVISEGILKSPTDTKIQICRSRHHAYVPGVSGPSSSASRSCSAAASCDSRLDATETSSLSSGV